MKFEMEKTTTRAVFGSVMLELARKDDRIMAVTGDGVNSMGLTEMFKEMPDRVLNTGIAEQNAMNIAAGMAATGLKPVIGGFAPFMTMRAGEQLRTFICYPNLNVKVAGAMAGLSASAEGVTHQGLEDIGILRTFPNMVITVPADAAAADVICRKVIGEHVGPAYIRLYKGAVYGVFDRNTYQFEIGRANWLRSEGTDATIICNGPVVCRALEAADALAEQNVHVRVLEMPCVKPLDGEAVRRAALETGAVVTVEDHQINCGLGGAVAEYLGENCPTIMKRLGIRDVFTESGDHYALLDKYGMKTSDIADAVKEVMAKKGKRQ